MTHPLLDAAMLDRYQALLDEDQKLRVIHIEQPDPTKRRLKVSCNGCDTPWCCNQRVDVDLVEALVVYRWATVNARHMLEKALSRGRELRTEKRRADEKKTRAGIVRMQGAPPPLSDDDEHFRKKLPCPFLVKGRCSVYAARPEPCRAHYMAGNPMRCREQLSPRETFSMHPDPALIDDLEHLRDDHRFFALVTTVEESELSQLLWYIHNLIKQDIRWSTPTALDWSLVEEADLDAGASKRGRR